MPVLPRGSSLGEAGEAPSYDAAMPSTPASTPAEQSVIDSRRRALPALLLLAEALLLVAVGVYSAVLASRELVSTGFGYGIAGFVLLLALALIFAANSLRAGGRFGIGFGLTWQMFQALVAASLLRAAMYWQGVLALVLAIVLFVMLTRISKEEHERAIAAAD